MDDNVQDICRVCRSEGSTEKPMYHPCICTGNIATIKRKPSFTPKIPLTSTTRNLAKQSENALLDIKLSSGDDEKLLRNGTLRLKRPSTHERLNSIIMRESTTTTQVQSNKPNNQQMSCQETVENIDCLRKKRDDFVVEDFGDDDDDLDDYPLPPPPETLTASLSCLSLNSLPPPPSEFLDDAINNCSINYNDDDLTTYIQRPTSITSSKSSLISTQSPNRRHSNAKPIASPVVPPKPNGLNGRIYESLNPLNNNYDDTRSTNDTISISSCDSNSTSNISSVGTSSSDSNISSRYQMIRINPPTEMIITKNTSESQISLSSSSSSIHQNNIQSMTTQSIVTTPQSKSEYQFQPHPVRNNESNNHERTDEPIYQQIPAHIETNQTQPNIIYHQPQSQKSQQHLNQQFLNQQQLLQQQKTHYQQPTNHNNNYNQKHDSIDGPIYQEVPKNVVHHNHHHSNNYGVNNTTNGNNTSINSCSINSNRESTISRRSSNGSNLSLRDNNSSPVIIANNHHHNPLNLESRSSNITSTQTRNNHNNNNNNNNHIINSINNDYKMSTFNNNNNKREIAASFNFPIQTRSPMRGPLPPPPELFLQDIHRVMDKKWKVAQQLSLDSSSTVNQLILGFRDPYDQMIQMIQMNEMLCLDELLNQQPLPKTPTSPYQPSQPSTQPQPPPPNHYETPPSMNQQNHHQHYQHQQQFNNQHQQNYYHYQQQNHISPSSCQQIDELPEYGHRHHHHHLSSSSSSSTSNSTQFTNNNLNTNLKISSPSSHYNGANVQPQHHQQQQQQSTNQDIPVAPPPPVLRCTNSSLYDKSLLRNKSGPPPPPRRSDKTRLSGRYQMRNESRNKPNQQNN